MRISRNLPRLSLLLALATCAGAGPTDLPTLTPLLTDQPLADLLAVLPDDVRLYDEHVTTLANPFMNGRAPGSPGISLAADYIEFNARALGLQPAFGTTTFTDDGPAFSESLTTYRQPYPYEQDLAAIKQAATVTLDGDAWTLEPERDFKALGYSGTGTFTGPLVFVGYSIAAGDDGYLSYTNANNITDKIALVLRFEPMDDEGDSLWTGGAGWSYNAQLVAKFNAATRRGAKAIILVSPPDTNDPRAAELPGIDLRAQSGRFGVPIVSMSHDAADRLLRAADEHNRSLADFCAIADIDPQVIDLPNATVTLDVTVEEAPRTTDNVGAILPGRGALADEYIVLGAHYDHVGMGYFGAKPENKGKLHPGADDNASGSAALLLAAKKLKAAYDALPDDADARSIIFVWFTAEEGGLHGSRWYVNHPPVPLDDHAFMLNLDMVGRMRDSRAEMGNMDSAEGLVDWLEPFFDKFNINAEPSTVGRGRSDHENFDREGVPNLFFSTGLHDDYHTPADTSDRINRAGAVRVTDLVCDVALAIAQRPDRFDKEETGRDDDNRPPPSFGARLELDADPGILIGDTFDGGPAQNAGLQPGDRVTKLGDHQINDISDWATAIASHRSGDEVEVTYERDGEQFTLIVKLEN